MTTINSLLRQNILTNFIYFIDVIMMPNNANCESNCAPGNQEIGIALVVSRRGSRGKCLGAMPHPQTEAPSGERRRLRVGRVYLAD